MKNDDVSSERRKDPRFFVNEGAMAFVAEKYGKVIDVSMKGLSFQYIENDKESHLSQYSRDKCIKLDIAFSARNFSLTDVPIKIISEQEIQSNSNHTSMLTKRRCSVAFKDLNPDQLFLLKQFVILNQYAPKN